MKNKLIVLSGFVLGLSPVVALAQVDLSPGTVNGAQTTPVANCTGGAVANIETLLCKISGLFNAVLPVLIGLAVVYFVFGVVSYVISDDEEAKTKGRDRIIYGVIGLAVIIGMWGLVSVVNETFGLEDLGSGKTFQLPSVTY